MSHEIFNWYQKLWLMEVIEAFSDADWNILSGDSLSTTGYIFNLGSGAICWKSKKKKQ